VSTRIGLIALWLACEAALAAPLQLYVAPDGDDKWTGRIASPNAVRSDGPALTLERARDLLREIRARERLVDGAIIWIRGGFYYLPRPLALSESDSGTEGASVTWRAYGNEKPVLTGARIVSKFEIHRGEILKAELRSQGLTGSAMRQLYFNRERQTIARYPNFDPRRPVSGGWAYVDGTPSSKYASRHDDSKRILKQHPSDVRKWLSVEGAEIFIFPRYNWWNNIVSLLNFDPGQRTLELTRDTSYAIRPGDRYFVQGLLAELDVPGEWVIDRDTSTLYFWPPSSVSAATVSFSVLENAVELTNVRHVILRGLQIEAVDGSAVVLRNAVDCSIEGNRITNAGAHADEGIYAVKVEGGARNRVIGNDIAQVGGGGILLDGGDRPTLLASNHVAENNHIHHIGVFYKQGVGIALDGVGNTAKRNLIHDTPRMGIWIRGNSHLVELNHLHHVNLETEDTGAVYAGGRDWLSPRGTIIRHNLIEDSQGFGFDGHRWRTPHFAFGIYLDDNASGVDVVGNIVARSSWANIYLHNARDNVIENNLLIDGRDQQIRLMAFRGPNRFLPEMSRHYKQYSALPAWQALRGFMRVPPETATPMANNVFVRNVIAYRGASSRYVWHRGLPASETRFESNIVFSQEGPALVDPSKGAAAAQWREWQALGLDRNSLRDDPKVVQEPGRAPFLSADSPAWVLGFKPIPTELIGPYASELRATWPIVEPATKRENLQ
jgi:parallel beta-helix repeat protein